MNEEKTFKEIYHEKPITEFASGIARMYNRILKKKPSEITLDELCFLIRQNCFSDITIPWGLKLLEENPWTGEYYEGELLYSFSCSTILDGITKEKLRKIIDKIDLTSEKLDDIDRKFYTNDIIPRFKKHGVLK